MVGFLEQCLIVGLRFKASYVSDPHSAMKADFLALESSVAVFH